VPNEIKEEAKNEKRSKSNNLYKPLKCKMKTPLTKSERFHFLDALRAILLLLGLFIHTAVVYTDSGFGLMWKINASNTFPLFMDWVIALIYSFWLPMFFILAGFFGSLLFNDRSALKMIKNRIKRIFLPLVAFLLLLWPMINLGASFSNAIFLSTPNSYESTVAGMNEISFFIPTHTFHLWFLYYLLLFSFTAFLLGLLFSKLPLVALEINDWFRQVLEQAILKVVFFSCISFLILLNIDQPRLLVSTRFLPDPNTFVFYFYFYLFGWLLYKSKRWIITFKKYDLLFTLLGLLFFNVQFFGQELLSKEAVLALHSFCIWLFCFGLMGLFVRHASRKSALIRYVADASYWVYLIHFALVVLLTGWMEDWAIPAFAKFLFTLTISTCICFVSYHYLVRATFIGQFLNGRIYPRAFPRKETFSESEKVKTRRSLAGLEE